MRLDFINARLVRSVYTSCPYFQVLTLMDEDSDGVVKVDHVMKVIELLGTVHAKLPAKQVRQIVEMLSKEELLKVEENIEHVMEKQADVEEEDKNLQSDLENLEKAVTISDVTKMVDNAIDLSKTDDKFNMKDNAKSLDNKAGMPPHVEEMFPDSKKEDSIHSEDERKQAKVKLSDKPKNGRMDLK